MSFSSSLGIELGSTRIKAVTVDENCQPLSSGDFVWKSSFVDGIWSYDLNEVWKGIKTALKKIDHRHEIACAGVSGMMHGYLAFDRDWKLLVPFRTWQNTMTAPAARELTELFHFNIPQRWSAAHLYQAVLNNESHIKNIAHITTLAGYTHYMLTGKNVLGIGEASGMFPIDSARNDYDEDMLLKFDQLLRDHRLPFSMRSLLPEVMTAGNNAGYLTPKGAKLLDHLLPENIPFAPPEGDAGTGMTATNAISPRTGNVSAGTSIFAMVVLEKQLSRVYEEIDMVTTPDGKPVAMVHCNNCTNDTNAWVSVLHEAAALLGADPSDSQVFTKLYEKSLEGEADCGGVLVCNYMAGEGITHMDAGCPIVLRQSGAHFTLANFFRAQLYSTMTTLKIGMEILAKENVRIDSLTGHGGLFKTPGVGQRYMAACCGVPITCMETAGEGGPYGMALLSSYMLHKQKGEKLTDYLNQTVFKNVRSTTMSPRIEDINGFSRYFEQYQKLLQVENTAVSIF